MHTHTHTSIFAIWTQISLPQMHEKSYSTVPLGVQNFGYSRLIQKGFTFFPQTIFNLYFLHRCNDVSKNTDTSVPNTESADVTEKIPRK